MPRAPRCCHSHLKRFCLTSAIGYARLIACNVGDEKFRCHRKRVSAQEVRRKEPGRVGRSKKLTTKAGISRGISDIHFFTACLHPQGCGDRAGRTRPGTPGAPGTNLPCPSGSKSFASHASPSPRPDWGGRSIHRTQRSCAALPKTGEYYLSYIFYYWYLAPFFVTKFVTLQNESPYVVENK